MPDLNHFKGKIKTFLRDDLWETDLSKWSRGQRFWMNVGQVVSLVARDFVADRCLLRASALTYTSILSIVPLLALMFALLKGLGVQNQLEPIILDQLAVGSEQIVTEIITYIDNTNVGRLGFVGLATLLLTVLALLSNIETSFNAVWQVEETRSLYRRFSDYFSVITIGPVLVLLAISMTSFLQSSAFIQALQGYTYVGNLTIFLFKLLPFVGMWIAFTALYIFMPNTRVKIAAALAGGIIGGSLWQLAQWGYVYFQVGVSKYNAIYGTMAALPIFMIWIYVSWLIVLLGLEFSHALQNLGSLRQEVRETEFNYASHEIVALSVALLLAEAFHRGERPWTMEKMINHLQLPPRLVRSAVTQLIHLGIISQVRARGEEDQAYQPCCSPQNLKVHEFISRLRRDGPDVPEFGSVAERRVVQDIEKRLSECGRETLNGLTLHDLVRRIEEEKGRLAEDRK